MDDGSRPARWSDAVDSLWVGALVIIICLCGAAWLPPLIQYFGRGGQRETVEWLVYVFLGVAFPVIAASLAWFGPRVLAPRALVIANTILALILLGACLGFFLELGPRAFVVSVAIAALTIAGVSVAGDRGESGGPPMVITGLLLAAIWAAAARLASWDDPAGWITQSVRTPLVLVLITACAILTLCRPQPRSEQKAGASWLTLADAPAILVFVVLSFRTSPIVEFYHWSFWVGPIESVRQGGWLLWDVPSQYGFLSVLMPALMPTSDAWQALYVSQALLYVVIAVAVYAVLKSFRAGAVARVFAFAFTAATLFFRPRTASLIIPAQMTPAGGPMRFFWCYAILAVICWKYKRGDQVSPRRFVLTGTAVWVASVAWSAESAIYCTVAWVAALAVFALQQSAATVSGPRGHLRSAAVHLVAVAAVLATGIVLAVLVITLVYRIAEGHGPDWVSYYEYALLFSGGYSALPIDGQGPVWYLVALFAAASTALVRFLVLDPRHPRVFVAAGAWGTIWAVSSYFVSRSHPVNLLSLVPLLVVALAIVLRLSRAAELNFWSRFLALAAVPLFTVPAALTWSHAGLVTLLREPQAPVGALTAQVPAMDSALASLAAQAGVKPADPVFFASDGRYVFPRWPMLADGIATTNEEAWMPKPYEMISTLPPVRRDAYIERFAQRIGKGGWLIQKKSEINPGYESVVRLIGVSFAAGEEFENEQWLIRRYVPRARAATGER